MQILRQAIFDQIEDKVITFKAFRNKIIYVTQSQLVISSVQLNSKKQSIQINGTDVLNVETHKDYIAVLFKSNKVQIRRLQKIKQLICECRNIQISQCLFYPILKWWDDELYLLYQNDYKKINIYSEQLERCRAPIETYNSKIVNIEFSDLFPQITNIIYHMKNNIVICLNQIKINSLDFEGNITQIVKLCHPLQEGSYNKQYLIVIQENKILKVFNMMNMKLIFQKKFTMSKNQSIKLEIDDLSQYLIVKSIDRKSCRIDQIYLMKINKQYYFSHEHSYLAEAQSFFLFQIQLGLKQDFHLFPSHSQVIKGVLCDSIDMCYLKQKQIFIASVVIKANYKNQIFHNKIKFQSPRDQLTLWKDIVISKINPSELLHKIMKTQIKNNNNNPQINMNIQQDLIVYAILKNLQACNDFQKIDQNVFQTIKKALYVHYFPMLLDVQSFEKDQQSRTIKQLLEKSNEDCINTMSGLSSSYEYNNSDCEKVQSKEPYHFINPDKEYIQIITSQQNQQNFSHHYLLEEHNELQFCSECEQIEDQHNLNFIQTTFKLRCDQLFQNSFKQIQTKLFLMENTHKFRLGELQKINKSQIRQQKSLKSTFNSQFSSLFDKIKQNIQISLENFSRTIDQKIDIRKSYTQCKSEIKNTVSQTQNRYKRDVTNSSQLFQTLQSITFLNEDFIQSIQENSDDNQREDFAYLTHFLFNKK